MNRGTASRFGQAMGFKNTDPESEEFKTEWDEMAKDEDFVENEQKFIRQTHFEPQINQLRNEKFPESLLNNNKFQQLVLDVAVNSGANTDIIITALKRSPFRNIDDIIRLVTEERKRRAEGTELESGLFKRFDTVKSSLTNNA